MKPDFSEFSYGYAVTEEIVSQARATLVGAPQFPSLYQEGQSGGGYDVSIPTAGKPVFLQFKLSDYLWRENAKEHKNGVLNVPYYRMHLRPLKHSEQHNLLLDLEAKGESVFYIAPEFHLPTELNDVYLRRDVVRNSAAFAPSDIGRLPDDEEHYLVFEKWATHGYICSDHPIEVNKRSLEGGVMALVEQVAAKSRKIDPNMFRDLGVQMLTSLRKAERRIRSEDDFFGLEGIERILNERNPIEGVAYISRTFYGAELIIFSD